MSFDPSDTATDSRALLADAGEAQARMRALRAATARDLLVPDAARLDDRRRAMARQTLYRTIDGYADALIDAAGISVEIDRAGLYDEVERRLGEDLSVANELIDRTTLDLLNEALPSGLVEPTPWPTVSEAHEALKAAEQRRADARSSALDLPAESQARFIWWTATAIAAVSGASLDHELANAARIVLARQDEGERLEAWAMRLAGLVDAEALPLLIDHCLGERRLVLLSALIARRLRLDYDTVRATMVDVGDARLWVALRALDLPRDTIARLGFALSEADPRRDVEAFADQLDAIMSIEPAAAGQALSPLRLPLDYRLAMGEGAGR